MPRASARSSAARVTCQGGVLSAQFLPPDISALQTERHSVILYAVWLYICRAIMGRSWTQPPATSPEPTERLVVAVAFLVIHSAQEFLDPVRDRIVGWALRSAAVNATQIGRPARKSADLPRSWPPKMLRRYRAAIVVPHDLHRRA